MLREFTTRESKISELKVSSDTELLFISTDRLLRSEAEPEYFHVHEKLCVSLNVVRHLILAQTPFGFVNNCSCDEMFTEMFVCSKENLISEDPAYKEVCSFYRHTSHLSGVGLGLND